MNTQSQSQYKVSLPKYMVKCKHGDECRWMKKGKCPFRHGNLPPKEVWCLNSSHCSNPDCQFKHKRDVWCRFDGYCSNEACLFKHRCSEVCKYGINCKRYGCLFNHVNVAFPNTFQPVSSMLKPVSSSFQAVSNPNTFQPISSSLQSVSNPNTFQPDSSSLQSISMAFQNNPNTYHPVSNPDTFQGIPNTFQAVFPVGYHPPVFVNSQLIQPQQVVPEIDNISTSSDSLSQVE